MDKEQRYLKFASSLSFFEFTQEEFYIPRFKIADYKEEIILLSKIKSISISSLKDLIKNNPKTFDILEQIFQMHRFSNTQLINFMFDIEIINSTNEKQIINYLLTNLKLDKYFKEMFLKHLKNNQLNVNEIENILKMDHTLIIKLFKEVIINYIETSSKKREWIYYRLRNYDNSSTRLSNYLLNNLKLNEMLDSINIESYLKNKRIPKDTKSIHGKFGTIKINKVLTDAGFINVDKEFKQLGLKDLSVNLDNEELKKFKDKWIFVTEKYVNHILKKKQRKKKKFDFVLIHNLKIKQLIETNFYSTSGTKIGINEEEYIDLNEEIKEKIPQITFIWVTDGNYWLTTDGEAKFKGDLDYFGENILSYNLLKEKLNNG